MYPWQTLRKKVGEAGPQQSAMQPNAVTRLSSPASDQGTGADQVKLHDSAPANEVSGGARYDPRTRGPSAPAIPRWRKKDEKWRSRSSLGPGPS